MVPKLGSLKIWLGICLAVSGNALPGREMV